MNSIALSGLGTVSLWPLANAAPISPGNGAPQKHWLWANASGCPFPFLLQILNQKEDQEEDQEICLYLLESQVPVLARHLLLIYLFLYADIRESMSLDEWATVLAEIYGNLLVRDKSWTWLQEHALPAMIQ